MNNNYQINLEEAKSELSKFSFSLSTQQNNIRFYKFPQGTDEVIIRILPTNNKIGKLVSFHYSLPVAEKKFLCYKTHNLPCKLCELLDEFSHKLDVSTMASKTRCFMNGIIMKHPTNEFMLKNTVYIIPGSLYDYQWIFQQLSSPEIGNFLDPYQGSPILFKREKFNGKFLRTIVPKSSPIAAKEEDIQKILHERYDLDSIWRTPDDEYHKKMTEISEITKQYLLNKINMLENPQPLTQPTLVNESNATIESMQKGKPTIPPNAPQCFGHYKGDTSCTLCAYDFQCSQSK